MAIEPTTAGSIGAITFIALNVIAFWFREWRKAKTWRANGKDLKEIKGDIKKIEEKQGKVAVELGKVGEAVNGQKDQCAKTVSRFDEEIRDQRKELLDLAKDK